VRYRGSTPTINTGPTVDHTLGTAFGTYLYFETSSPTRRNDTALFISPVFDNTTLRCFEFWYHMYGSGDARLNVIQQGYNVKSNGTVVWTDMNNYGDVWKYGSVTLPATFGSSYVIQMQAVAGQNTNSDVALDDLKVTNNAECPTPDLLCSFKCPNGQCIPLPKVCNFVNDCPNGEEELDCAYNNITFENGQVGKWTNNTNGAFKWQLGRNGNGATTGPSTGTRRPLCILFSFYSCLIRTDFKITRLNQLAVISSIWTRTSERATKTPNSQVQL